MTAPLFGASLPIQIPDQPFEMPDDDSSRAEWKAALVRLNAVEMTIDQLERGMELFNGTFTAESFNWLVAFCREEGLHPPDVAAHAMQMRWEPVREALEGDIVLKRDYPEDYATLVTAPIEELFDYMCAEDFG